MRLHTPSGHARPTGWRLRVELVRGWVHALALEDALADTIEERRSEADLERAALLVPPSPRSEARAAQLFAAAARADFSLQVVDEPRRRQGALTPFHPLPVLRAALAELFASSASFAEQLVYRRETSGRAATLEISLTAPLHGSALDPDEQAVVALLRRPRAWQEIAARMAPPRMVRFVRDAVLLGAMSLDGDPELGAELRALARDAGPAKAREAARRRAYHAEARALHPDLHAEGSDEEQSERTRAMAELAEKHRRGR